MTGKAIGNGQSAVDALPRRPVFAECKRCGERWVFGYVPLAIDTLVRTLKRTRCPNCDATPKLISLCATDGKGAVKKSRRGVWPVPSVPASLSASVPSASVPSDAKGGAS